MPDNIMQGQDQDYDLEIERERARARKRLREREIQGKMPSVPVQADVTRAPKGRPFQQPTIGPSVDPRAAAIRLAASNLPIIGPSMIAAGRAFDEGIPFREAADLNAQDIAEFSRENPGKASLLNLAANINPARWALSGAKAAEKAAAARGASALGRMLSTKEGQGMVVGGTLAGAHRLGQQAQEEPLADRLLGTGQQAAIGTGLGWAFPTAMQSNVARPIATGTLGALAAPEGDEIPGAMIGAGAGFRPSEAVKFVAPAVERFSRSAGEKLRSLSEAVGSRGRTNMEFEGMEAISRPFRRHGVTGPRMVDLRSRMKERADALYAKMEKSAGNNKALRPYLKDPDFQLASAKVMTALGLEGTSPFRPDVLHSIKRLVDESIGRGGEGAGVIPQDVALRLRPKITSFRQTLHRAYPDMRKADNWYQLSKVAEEALQKGGEAVRRMVGADPESEKVVGIADPAGARQWVETLRHTDPAQQQLMRKVATQYLRHGAAGAVNSAIDLAGTKGGRQAILDLPIFRQGSGQTLDALSLALGSLDDAMRFRDMTLKRVQWETPRSQWTKATGWRRPFQLLAGEKDAPMDTPYAQDVAGAHASDMLRNMNKPRFLERVAGRYRAGNSLLEYLNALGVSTIGTPADWSDTFKDRGQAAVRRGQAAVMSPFKRDSTSK